MTSILDTYLMKSEMPSGEHCPIGHSQRAFYYYCTAFTAALAVIFASAGILNMIN